MESVDPRETTTNYVETKNASGETVYRRDRYVGPSLAPYPTPTPYPTPVPAPPLSSAPVAGVPVSAAPISEPLVSTPSGPNNLVVKTHAPVQLADAPPTPEEEKARKRFGLGAELSSDSKRTHLGVMVLGDFDFVEAKLGLSLFKGSNDWYAGFDLGARPKIQFDHFALFGGVGIYGGDTKSCTIQNSIESCEKKFLYAGYVEAGVYLWSLSLFARSYNIQEAGKTIPSDTFYGVGFRTNY